MADSRRQTRSTRRREHQTDAQFWSNQPDPLMIERGQTDAIRLVRNSVNPASETASGPTEANATNVSGIPQMVFVADESLEEQFLTDEETTNVLNTSANRVTTPVNTNQSIQQIQHEELDLQPSRGPREESIVHTIDQFLDENYEDVLRTSNIQTNFSLSASNNNVTRRPVLPLGWVIPDGTNRTLEEIKDRKISNDQSPGGGQAGAVVITLQRLEPYLGTQFFLVDLETGEMFAYIRQQWRRTGLNCSDKPFVINDLMQKVERQGQAVWAELEAEDQTPLVNIRRSPGRFEVPPPLPVMDEPAVYVLHPDVMQINTRKNYVRDRMRAALIYVSEYAETKRMMMEGRYNNDDLLVRLRAVFGRVDQVRHHIDVALQQDDAHRRKRNMRFLVLPTRFPRPESMSQGDTTVWTNWIREETDEIMKQLEEEGHSRSDPDDPFSGTANGVFQPLQDTLSLPPPVQTPTKQGNNSEGSEHSQNSRKKVRKHNTASREERRNETATSAQGEPREFREHSRESLDPMASIRNLHIQQRHNRRSIEELNQNTVSAPQTSRMEVNQEEANLITFSPVVEQQVPLVQEAKGVQVQPKQQRSPRKKKGSEWTLNQRQFDHSKTQEISHILPGEQLNVFPGEESVSYLQLPVKKKEDNRFCTRCGERGHGRRYCQVNTWCKFCVTDTHATQACRRYEKFVKDNPIASSRRNTPVQTQVQRATVNPQEQPQQPQPLFPHPPVQRYNPTVIPRMQMHNVTPQREKRESREHSRKSPQHQIKEVQTLMSKQLPHQWSCQDVRMDPRYQEPPQYAEINYHRPSPPRPVEVNEIGPTIQQGVIQRPVQRQTQPTEGLRRQTVPVNAQQTRSVHSLQVIDRKQESDPEENGYVINCIHENRPFTVNDVGRPVFVNHYYAGEAFIPVTNKQIIKLDECDVSTENSPRSAQPQAIEREFGEHSRNSRIIQQMGEAEREQVPRHGKADVHSDLREDSQNSRRMTSVSRNTDASRKQSNAIRGIHSEFVEHSQQSLGTLNVGKSRVQAADQMNMRHIPLTGYENFRQELQTYPVSRDPMTVQPTGVGTASSSAILDLPNVNTNLPPPLLPNPSSQYHQQQQNQAHPTEVNSGQVTNSEILRSIQSITEVMQQQLLLNSKTTEHGIVQTASLFQEMIKAQEKRDLDPALLAIPTFLGEAKDRPQCLDWVSRVKNICDQSGRAFRQELINKSGILVQNFIRSLSENITNKELTEKILQFFSDVPTTSHALNKLRLIRQGAEEPIVNYNQRYQNLVERVEGCQLDSIRSTVAMELYLGSIIEPIRKSIRNTLYFNSKHAPKTLGEAMQKAQDLHIKHLYAIGEDQDSVANSSDVLPEITVNEVTSREDRGWYRNKRDFREHSQNSREKSPQMMEYSKQVTYNQPSETRTTNSSEYSDSSRNSRVPNNYSKEQDIDKTNQQPSVIRGSFMQIMVNPMQLQDHEFTAWLDRLVEARKNRQEKRQRPYRNFRKPYNESRQNGDTASRPPLRNRIKPAQELEIQQIMDNFNCEYDDVVESVDLYNLDVEECTTA